MVAPKQEAQHQEDDQAGEYGTGTEGQAADPLPGQKWNGSRAPFATATPGTESDPPADAGQCRRRQNCRHYRCTSESGTLKEEGYARRRE
jgi:hypothetical protein